MMLGKHFYCRDVLQVAPELLGKTLIRKNNGKQYPYTITEVEAYRGAEDEASHARFGKTSRNHVMFDEGGLVYVYLIYGIYWMLNIVTGTQGIPQAILIRGIAGFSGPGKVSRVLGIDKTFYGENLTASDRIWIEDSSLSTEIIQQPRIGIDYAGEPWKSMPWRYIMAQLPQTF